MAAANSVPAGAGRSSTNLARPVTLSRASRRGATVSVSGMRPQLLLGRDDRVDVLQEEGHQVGVPLAATALTQDLDRPLTRHAGPVHAIGGHGSPGVAHGDDAGAQRDVGAPQLIRVAPAVPALVMVADG